MNSNIVLIGMPGSGKSTCGVVAAKMLLKNFYDTDLLIQNIEGISLQNIIDAKGIEYFEKAEENAILSLELRGTVIATGGSVVYSDRAMEHLKKLGKIIYLHLDYDNMMNRINNLSSRGIAVKQGKTLLDMYKERLPLYQKWADIIIDCNNNTVEETASAIKEASL
ncbi:MAG: shikimate kinase [Acetobacter sp.]|nr:shikimate kinase [Bacteroides sp.]MCM1341267.1 shikimate kinase [Acetobacter sp.]MCM1433956.1 shikimate kinase [Clostridiales bacterium]